MVVTFEEDTAWEGTVESWARGAESVLYLDLGSGYTDTHIYKNSPSFIIQILAL